MNSHAISLAEVRAAGCFTILPVRRTNIWKTLEDVAAEAGREWRDVIQDETPQDFHGIDNPVSGAWDALVLPDFDHERLRLVAWTTHTFFLIDDKADRLPREEAHNLLNKDLIRVFDARYMWEEPKSPLAKLLVPVIRTTITLDPKRGLPIMSEWMKWFSQVDSRSGESFDSLEDYLKYRTMNIAWHPYCRIVIYGMKLSVTDQEIESTFEYRECASRSYSLTNDWWSWAKERKGVREGTMRMMNAVSVLMRLESLTEQQALDRVKSLVLQYERDLLDWRDSLLARPALSEDFRAYVDAFVHMSAGNSMWSSTTERYKV